MAKKRIIIIALSLSTVFSLAYLFSLDSSCLGFSQGTITVNNSQRVAVDFAITESEQTKGLSGCSSIKSDQGMYFVFPQKTKAVFWMKDMIIPIDIIWISDNKVIGVERNVPPPKDNNLIKYHAPYAVDAVLELGAGSADELQIRVDTPIQIQKND